MSGRGLPGRRWQVQYMGALGKRRLSLARLLMAYFGKTRGGESERASRS